MYKEIGLYGYILLFIYYLINASNNINNNESNSIIFGSFCIIFGFIFIIIEKYKNIKYINLKNNFLYGPIILALFNFFSLFLDYKHS